MVTAIAEQQEVAQSLAAADIGGKTPVIWQLSDALLEITSEAMYLTRSDQDETRDLEQLHGLLDHIAQDNEIEDRRHLEIIAMCRAAQALCRRVAAGQGQTGGRWRENGKAQETAEPPVQAAAPVRMVAT